jgi:uncharacterized FlaG/YvyC family protein
MPALDRASPAPSRPLMDKVPQMATSTDRAAQIVEATQVNTDATKQRIALAEKALGVGKALVIEKDNQRQGYIYKTIDRATGEVVRLWPIQEVATALQSLNDIDARSVMAGMMFDTTA